MNTNLAAKHGYAKLGAHTRGGKDLEYDVILKVTRDLKQFGDPSTCSYPTYVKALNNNERLWNEVAAQVADDNNALPVEVRAGLFNMAQFVSRTTTALLNNKGDAQSLIEINVAVLRGLKGQG